MLREDCSGTSTKPGIHLTPDQICMCVWYFHKEFPECSSRTATTLRYLKYLGGKSLAHLHGTLGLLMTCLLPQISRTIPRADASFGQKLRDIISRSRPVFPSSPGMPPPSTPKLIHVFQGCNPSPTPTSHH
ncbi:hypothetical protein KSP40_PGU000183 [Platanthera guangdongensis]|uniref:Uncharacterized protein n=1 Tax=Platanthera guangdongensis TaxID=2320717 RepID=A0ABR2LVL6_9ASPA